MKLKPLQIQQLPNWMESGFAAFTVSWLQESDIRIADLCRKEYNYLIQTLIRSEWIGESCYDASNISDFHEFRFSACIFLNSLISSAQ